MESNQMTNIEFIKYLGIIPGIIYFYYYIIYKQNEPSSVIEKINTNTNIQKSVDKLSTLSANSLLSAPYPNSSSVSVSSI